MSEHAFHPHTHREEYHLYLAGAHWQSFKRDYSRSHPFCCVCGSRQMLDINHLRYDTMGHEKWEDVVRLCHPHHEEFHAALRAHHWPVDYRHSTAILKSIEIAYTAAHRPRRFWLWRLLFGG